MFRNDASAALWFREGFGEIGCITFGRHSPPPSNPKIAMKTLSRFLTVTLLTGSFAAATFAAPPSQRIPAPSSRSPVQTAPEVTDQSPDQPTCAYMRDLPTGATKAAKAPRFVRCTAETMKNNPRCREMCEEASKRMESRDDKARRPGSTY